MFSGPSIDEGFTAGWALKAFTFGKKAHWWRWRPDGDSGVKACAPNTIQPLRLRNGQIGLFEPGTYPRCKRCEARRAGAKA